jgi:CRISPR-associated endonuclease/helicase Cas3
MGAYRHEHAEFIERRVNKLAQLPARRKAEIRPCQFLFDESRGDNSPDALVETRKSAYFHTIAHAALVQQSRHFTIDQCTGLSVSFGVIRVANIKPCVDLTQYLLEYDWPVGTHARIMAYHSQQTLLMRNEQEKHLDQVLRRKEKPGEQPKTFVNEVIREHLDNIHRAHAGAQQVVFILVATPVEEVGRDHDFDWAVVEPSSYRSIVQLAGRVRRHRRGEVEQPNISLMQFNWKGVKNYPNNERPVFARPGFESKYFRLKSHDLSNLINENLVGRRLDATPRIQKPPREQFDYLNNLADLEHADTKRLLTRRDQNSDGPQALDGYLRQTWFLTAFCQTLTPFRQSAPSLKIFLVYDDSTDSYTFCEKDEQGQVVSCERKWGITHIELSEQIRERLWLERDYDQSVQEIYEDQEISRRRITLRFGELSFRCLENKYYVYNDQLGLVEQ